MGTFGEGYLILNIQEYKFLVYVVFDEVLFSHGKEEEKEEEEEDVDMAGMFGDEDDY